MSEKFDWQTEEEVVWDDLSPQKEETAASWRPSWLAVSLVVVVLSLAVAVVYRQVEQQVADATTAVKREVLATHKLVQTAAARGDGELFYSVLSGRDRRWTETQERLVARGLFVERDAFGLRMADAGTPEEVDLAQVVITLSPDLNAAEVLFPQPFVIDAGDGVTETVTLQQTAVYRQGPRGWLYSPPLPEFWGEEAQSQGDYLTLVYPEREQVVAERLAADLDDTLAQMCRSLADINCPQDLHVRLRLETDPQTLVATADPETIINGGLRLDLPTPTLVGLPLDEAGYQALTRGYAVNVVSAVITDLVGYQCCDQGLFYQALLDKQLSQLDLRPWPLSAAVYEQMLGLDYSAGTIYLNWTVTSLRPDEDLQIHSLIDFLLARMAPTASLAEMQRQLTPEQNFWRWLQSFSDSDDYVSVFDAEWLDFVYGQTISAQLDSPPIAWPEQDILVQCGSNRGLVLYRHDLAAGTWREEIGPDTRSQPFMDVNRLPGGDGYLLSERWRDGREEGVRLVLWRDGEETVALERTLERSQESPASSFYNPGPYFTGWSDPTGRYLVLATSDPEQGRSRYHLLDLDNCDGEDCQLQPLPGQIPVWSPDGRQTLMIVFPDGEIDAQPFQYPLYRGDARGQPTAEVGPGSGLFWLDDERYGYVRLNDDRESELVIASTKDDEAQIRLTSSDLLAAIPDQERPERLFIMWPQVNPADDRLLSILASTSVDRSGTSYLFLWQREAEEAGEGELTLLWRHSELVQPGFSPDGRWLTAVNRSRDFNVPHTARLFDLDTGQERTITKKMVTGVEYFYFVWSADGQWFVRRNSEQSLIVTAPAVDYQLLVPHEFGDCYRLFWQ